MKVKISKKALALALEKGALAAMSEEAQTDTTTLSLIIKSVKITADDNLTVESGTDLMSVKYSTPATKGNGIIVKEAGYVVVPAKELSNWVNDLGDESVISMSLNKLKTPEAIDTLDEMEDVDGVDKSKFLIKKVGSLELESKDTVTTNSHSWDLSCYDEDCFGNIKINDNASKCFDLTGKYLSQALKNVSFASLDKDAEHVLDSVSIQKYKDDVYFTATDLKRCCLYKVPKEGVSNIELSQTVLVPIALLEKVSKIINSEDIVSFSSDYNSDKRKVYLSCKSDNSILSIKLTSTDEKYVAKFPSIKMLLEKPCGILAKIARGTFCELLISASRVNKSTALFLFDKDSSTFTVKAISEDAKYSPKTNDNKSSNILKNARVIWGVQHLLDVAKVIESDEIELHVPETMKSLKVTGKDNENMTYFTMAMDNPLYSTKND
jgi:DNA polymerase III sliding clamp (beta) subunit (PCNA family)